MEGLFKPTKSFQSKKNEKLPGLEVLSNLDSLMRHKNIQVGSRGGIDWKDFFKELLNELLKLIAEKIMEILNSIDLMVTNHVSDFVNLMKHRYSIVSNIKGRIQAL